MKVTCVAPLIKEKDKAILGRIVGSSKAIPHDVQRFVRWVKKNRLDCNTEPHQRVDEKSTPLRCSAKTTRDKIERCQGTRCDSGQRFCRD